MQFSYYRHVLCRAKDERFKSIYVVRNTKTAVFIGKPEGMLRVDRWDNIHMDIKKIVTGFERVGRSVRSRDEFICYVDFVYHFAFCMLGARIE